MTSTRKTIMIAGGLLVAAAGTAYVMLLRADHRAIEDAGIGDSAAPVAAAPAGNDHAVQGAIAPPAPAAATAPKQAAAAPPPAPTAPAPAPAPAATARVDAAPAPVPVVSDKPQPVTKPAAPPPKVNVVTVNPEDSTPPAPAPAQTATVQPTQSVQPARSAAPAQSTQRAQVTQRAPRKRDGLERHAAAAPPAATKSETPETAALVRESAKLDPSLPPPSMSSISSMPASTGSYRQGSASSGANPVAAAMTEQLVRQSSSIKSTALVPADGGTAATK
ncbi:extensin [Burkholderia cenocepacia]|uniref:extensin n=1 Tax=Burkholderia cenocepacia TaxID=95486 RepID=UPI00158A2CBA|nr:extensin [Burkholderia cenocepacia]MBR7954402.1 extensin [Burkholderia cenocepacia]